MHRLARSAHNPNCTDAIEGYALFEAPSSQPLRQPFQVLLVRRDRSHRWEPCEWNMHGAWVTPGLSDPSGWYVVGWRYCDGSWPTGAPHKIDVRLVDFERCPHPRRDHPRA